MKNKYFYLWPAPAMHAAGLLHLLRLQAAYILQLSSFLLRASLLPLDTRLSLVQATAGQVHWGLENCAGSTRQRVGRAS